MGGRRWAGPGAGVMVVVWAGAMVVWAGAMAGWAGVMVVLVRVGMVVPARAAMGDMGAMAG